MTSTEKNETICYLEGVDGKLVGMSIDKDGHFFKAKTCGHESCLVMSSFYLIETQPTEEIFKKNPELERDCSVCKKPLLRTMHQTALDWRALYDADQTDQSKEL